MVGYLAQHALGRYDLPLPTDDDPSLAFVVPNLAAFEEAWSLDRRDLRFAVALHEVVHAAERSVPWVRERLLRARDRVRLRVRGRPARVREPVRRARPERPVVVRGHRGAPRSAPRRDAVRASAARSSPACRAFTMVLEGYADVVVERLGSRLLTDFPRVHEAMQRHHVERGEAERFIEQLLGLRLERDALRAGRAVLPGRHRARRHRGAEPALGVRADAPDAERARRARPLARPDRPPRARRLGCGHHVHPLFRLVLLLRHRGVPRGLSRSRLAAARGLQRKPRPEGRGFFVSGVRSGTTRGITAPSPPAKEHSDEHRPLSAPPRRRSRRPGPLARARRRALRGRGDVHARRRAVRGRDPGAARRRVRSRGRRRRHDAARRPLQAPHVAVLLPGPRRRRRRDGRGAT